MVDRKESVEAGRSGVEEGVRDRERVESEPRAENRTMVRRSVRGQSSEGRILFLMLGRLRTDLVGLAGDPKVNIIINNDYVSLTWQEIQKGKECGSLPGLGFK